MGRRGRAEGRGVRGSDGQGRGRPTPQRIRPPLGASTRPSLSAEGVECQAVDGGRGSWEACLGDGIHFPVATMCEMKIG